MNFLAHIYLSGEHEEILIGNFAGDFIKGNSHNNYSPGIQKGVLLHREIDRFTDDHPVVLQSKERLRPAYHHYAPVIVDVFYDHFLAAGWHHYHKEELMSFTKRAYKIIDRYLEVIPSTAAHMFKYMSRDNWLYHYKYIEGVDRALSGMSRRTPYESNMENSALDLKKDYVAYKNEFDRFFPDLVSHSKSYLDSLS